MATRVYEPPPDPSSVVDIETEDYGAGRRQVMRAPQTEAELALLRSTVLTNEELRATPVIMNVAPETPTSATITTSDGSANLTSPQAGSFCLHAERDGDTSFSASIRPPSSGNYTFVFERSINYGHVPTASEVWTAVGAFQAGTPIIKSTWTQADASRALEFHGNMSATGALRVRFTNFPANQTATVLIRSGRGPGTVTVGNPIGVRDATTHTQQLKINTQGQAHVVQGEPAGGLPAISVDQYAQLRTRNGQVFSASSGRHDAGAVGSTTIKMLLQNPVGSGKTLHVFRLDLFSSAQIGFFSFLINPTTALPTTARTINNHFIGHPTLSVAKAFADVGTAMSGGSDSGIVIPVPSGTFNKLKLEAPYIISPGVALAIQATFTAATACVVTADWLEE